LQPKKKNVPPVGVMGTPTPLFPHSSSFNGIVHHPVNKKKKKEKK
jgi:hypothetical protein